MKNIKSVASDFISESNVSVRQTLSQFREHFDSSTILAIGENSHFIKEFFTLRHQIIEFLITECNFDTIAFEFGFSEGLKIDKWIKSKLPLEDLDSLLSHFYYPTEFKATLLWLRNYNQKNKNQITFSGLDVPKNGGSYFPTFHIVADYLQKNSIASSDILKKISDLVEKLDFLSTSQLALNLSNIDNLEHNELKALLLSVYIRLISLQPKLESLTFQTVLHQVKGLMYTNYNANAMADFINEKGLEGDMGAKDQFMAESIDWFLKNSLGKKIILVAHNAHIQKTPVDFDGFISCYPMGQRLAMSYGSGYKAFAITNFAGETSALYPDNEYKFGFKVDKFPLGFPESDSIEFFMRKSGLEEGLLIMNESLELKNHKTIRFDSMYLNTEIQKAFDGIFLIEKSTVSEVVN